MTTDTLTDTPVDQSGLGGSRDRRAGGDLRPAVVSAIVWANLLRQTRDRVGMFFIVIMPFVAIIFVGFTIGAAGSTSMPVGVVASDDNPVAARVLAELEQSEGLEVQRFDDEAALDVGVREGSLAAGLTIPSGSTEFPVTYSGTSGTGAAARGTIDGAVARVSAEMEATRAAEAAGASPEEAARLVAEAQATTTPVEIAGSGGDDRPQGFAYTAPANLVLFTFINSMAVAAALVESRKLGMIRRILAGPVTKRAVLFGEALSRFLIAALQAVLIIAVSSLVFGVNWGEPLAVVVVVGVFCLVATGAAMLIGSLVSSPTQPAVIGPTLGIILGMLGGCLWPKEVAPDFLNTIGYLFPHAWAMDALISLSDGRAGLASVLPEVAVLAGMAAALLGLALWLFDSRALKDG